MPLEEVEKLMQDSADAKEYEQSLRHLLGALGPQHVCCSWAGGWDLACVRGARRDPPQRLGVGRPGPDPLPPARWSACF